MSDFPQVHGGGKGVAIGVDTGGTNATSLTAPASANTKGAWTELIASTSEDIQALCVHVGALPATSVQLIDIGIGASSSEVVVFPNLMTHRGTVYIIEAHYLPVYIPKGSRISARYQTQNTTGDAVLISMAGDVRGMAGAIGLQQVQALGVDTTDSSGTAIDPGGVADTKGSWVELSAATSERIKIVSLAISVGSNLAAQYAEFLIDIGVGGSGSEVVIVADLLANSSTTEEVRPSFYGPISVDIAPGSRVAVRAQCSITDATDRIIDAIVYGYG